MRLTFDTTTDNSYAVVLSGVRSISFTEDGMLIVLDLCGKNLSELETWQNTTVDHVSLYDKSYKRKLVLNYTLIHGIFPISIEVVDNKFINATFSTDFFENINTDNMRITK